MKPDIAAITAEHYAIRDRLKAQDFEFQRARFEHDAKMRLISLKAQQIIHEMNKPLYDLMRDIKNS